MRSIPFKLIVISTCLLLVLASVTTIQIAGQSIVSVAVCFNDEINRLSVFINEIPFCINLSETTNVGNETQLIGDLYLGPCDDLGDQIGIFNGTIEFDPSGVIILNFTVGFYSSILHIESKFIDIMGDIECEYAFVETNGDRVNLFLIEIISESGNIAIDEENGIICLPTFIFSIGKPSTRHDLNSTQDDGATTNKGTITINGTQTYTLPDYDYFWDDVEHQITYNPEKGYAFVRWETGGTSEVEDPNSQTTTLTTHDARGYLTAVYREISIPVGGYSTSVDKSAILTPYVAFAGLIGVAFVLTIRKRRKD